MAKRECANCLFFKTPADEVYLCFCKPKAEISPHFGNLCIIFIPESATLGQIKQRIQYIYHGEVKGKE